MSNNGEKISVEIAAILIKKSIRTVQDYCAKGIVKATKEDGEWKIYKKEFEKQYGPFLQSLDIDTDDINMNGIIAFTNNKGGVGKTTLTIVTADRLSLLGYRVLVVDMDPQRNATTLSGLQPFYGEGRPGRGQYKETLYEVIVNQIYKIFDQDTKNITTSTAIYKTNRGFHVLPSPHRTDRLKYWLLDHADEFDTGEDIKAVWDKHFPFLLSRALDEIKNNYDVILIDTPPELGWESESAMMCSDYCVVPVELGQFELTGLYEVYDFITSCALKNPNLNLLGIVISRYGPHVSNLDKDLEEQLRNDPQWQKFIFDTIIKRSLLIREATINSKSVFESWRNKLSLESLQTLEGFTDELIKRIHYKNSPKNDGFRKVAN